MLASGFYQMDCMAAMQQFPDKFFDLAIVDPPYGGGGVRTHGQNASGADSAGGLTNTTLAPAIRCTRTGGTWATKYRQRRTAA